MRISWKDAKYNEDQHVQIERLWSRRRLSRYYVGRFRKLRKLAKAGIKGTKPIPLPIVGGEIVTEWYHGKAVGREVSYESME